MGSVRMPDGSVVKLPDNPTPDDFALIKQAGDSMAAQQAQAQPPQPAEPGIGQHVTDFVRDVPAIADTTIRGGLGALPLLGLQAFDAGGTAIRESGILPEFMTRETPGLQQTIDFLKAGLTPNQPKTEVGKAVGNIGAATVGGMIAPGKLAANAIIGAGSGVGAEAANLIFKDNPVARFLGGIIGGGVTGIARAERDNIKLLAREATTGISDKALRKAAGVMKKSEDAGIPMVLSQALSKPSTVDTYVDALSNSSLGKNVVSNLRQQPEAATKGFRNFIEHTLPGTARSPHTMANNMQESALHALQTKKEEGYKIFADTFDDGIAKLQKQIMQESQKKATLYNGVKAMSPEEALVEASKVPYATVSSLYDDLTNQASKLGENTELHKEILKLRQHLVQGDNFVTDAHMLANNLRSYGQSLKPGSFERPSASVVEKQMYGVMKDVQKNLGKTFAPYRDAATVYKNYQKAVIEPLKKDVIGRLAGKQGTLSDTEAPLSKLSALLKAGTNPLAPKGSSEILKLQKELTAAGRSDDFMDMAKTHFAEVLNKAIKSPDNRPNPNAAGVIRKELGSPSIRDSVTQGTEDLMVGVARAQGIPAKNEKLYAKGLSGFMDLVARISNRPAAAGTNPAEITATAASSGMNRIGALNKMTIFRQPVLAWSMKLQTEALKTMDNLLSSSKNIEHLITLGKEGSNSTLGQSALAAILASNAATQPRIATEEQSTK